MPCRSKKELQQFQARVFLTLIWTYKANIPSGSYWASPAELLKRTTGSTFLQLSRDAWIAGLTVFMNGFVNVLSLSNTHPCGKAENKFCLFSFAHTRFKLEKLFASTLNPASLSASHFIWFMFGTAKWGIASCWFPCTGTNNPQNYIQRKSTPASQKHSTIQSAPMRSYCMFCRETETVTIRLDRSVTGILEESGAMNSKGWYKHSLTIRNDSHQHRLTTNS